MSDYNNYRQKNYVKLTKSEYDKTEAKRYSRFKSLIIKRLIVLLFILGLILLYLECFISPIIKNVATAQVDNLTVKALNEAVRLELGQLKYEDFVTVVKDNNNRVAMLQAKTAQINISALRIAKTAQEQIDVFSHEGIALPLGVFSGVALLAGYGPDINVRINTQGHVYVSFQSEFIGQGINQTLHRIYVYLTSTVSIVVPTISNAVRTKVQILLTEAIILGEVPNILLGGFLQNGEFE